MMSTYSGEDIERHSCLLLCIRLCPIFKVLSYCFSLKLKAKMQHVVALLIKPAIIDAMVRF